MPVNEQLVDVPGARIWSCVEGQGRDVLVFNGGPGCDDYLAPVARMLVKRCRVVRFESRGCGRSDWDGNYHIDTTISDAEAVLQHHGMRDVVLLGHSQGPNHALLHAMRHPQNVTGIIGIAGGKVVDDRNWSEVFHRNWDESGGDLGGLEFHADPEVNRVGNQTYRDLCRSETFLRDIAAMAIPVAFINAEKDIRPNWPTRQLSALLRRSRYREISGAPHNLWLTHPAELEAELHAALDWIEGKG